MKKTQYITLILILALGLIGGAYAYWQETLTVEGTVTTGNMRVEWNNFYLRTPDSGAHSPAPLPEYVTADAYVDPSDPQNAVLIIGNLYPMPNSPAWHEGQRVAVTGYMENMGSIPVKFVDAEIDFQANENEVADWMRADIRIAKRISGSWTVIYTHAGVPLNDLPSAFANAAGTELGIGDLLGFGDETLYLYLDENAPVEVQDSSLAFTLKLNFSQWNAP